ncbi:hypothetical protein SAMN05216259_1325, partial [Actinacidiphila guanduensis]
LPPLAIVPAGAGPTALTNWMRAVAGLSREHWAPRRGTSSYHGVNREGDFYPFYLDFAGRIPLVMTTLDRLKEHGLSGPVWLRIDGYRPAEGQPLLQALADIRPYADFHQRQERREQAAEAERQRRAEAERRELEARWARAEWFDKRKRKMKELAGLWDEAGTADER